MSQVTMARPDVVSREAVVASVNALGFTPEWTERLMNMFELAVGHADFTTGVSDYVDVDMTVHDMLDAIAPDMRYWPTPNSPHDLLNRHFLPHGWTFLHDRHGNCSLQAVRLF